MYLGEGHNWTESNLTTTNASAKGVFLTEITGEFIVGETYTFDLPINEVLGDEDLDLILEMDAGGNDVSFASKENSAFENPTLRVKNGNILGASNTVQTGVYVFPNPATNYVIISNLESAENWTLVNSLGNAITTGTETRIDVQSLDRGFYFLELSTGEVVKFMK